VERLPPCTERNEAHNVLAGSSILKTVGSLREEPEEEHYLHVEKGHQRGLVGTLRGSRYLGKNTCVVHGSLHLYLFSLASSFTFNFLSSILSFAGLELLGLELWLQNSFYSRNKNIRLNLV
jgi:hypothetical protein